MSEQPRDSDDPVVTPRPPDESSGTDYGSLSVEDNPEGTVDPAELAGTGRGDDATVGYEPESTQADSES
jgi:hypothetical protein